MPSSTLRINRFESTVGVRFCLRNRWNLLRVGGISTDRDLKELLQVHHQLKPDHCDIGDIMSVVRYSL